MRAHLANATFQAWETQWNKLIWPIMNQKVSARSPCSIKYTPKPKGVHSGVVCHVTKNSTTTIYYIKTHYGCPNESSRRALKLPDEREIFLYILLHKCGFGPEPHFFGTGIGNMRTLLIATKELPNLILAEELTSATATVLLVLKIVATLYDVHGKNCGSSNGQPAIFDFKPAGFDSDLVDLTKDRGYKHLFINSVPSFIEDEELRQQVDEYKEDKRMQLARDCLRKWDIASKLELAKREAVAVINHMKEEGLTTRSAAEPKQCLTNYVKDIRRMLDFLEASSG